MIVYVEGLALVKVVDWTMCESSAESPNMIGRDKSKSDVSQCPSLISVGRERALVNVSRTYLQIVG